jgi:signal-transduction protein with cAMP-binding, CBS, and nucleotidyltransferase domain
MKTGLSVIEAMTKNLVSVSPKTTVFEVAKLMKREHVGSVIVEENKKLIGILSEQDLVYKIVAQSKDPKKTLVKEIMVDDVISINPENDITEAMLKMSKLNVRRLPVVEEGKIVGMLTMKDILKVEPQLFELIVDKIELREENNKPINLVGEREGICELCNNYTPFLFEMDESLVCKDCRE